MTRGGAGGRRSSVVALMMVVATGGRVPVLSPGGLIAHDEVVEAVLG